jgi:hypothetical protein
MTFSEQNTAIIQRLLVDRSVPAKEEYLAAEHASSRQSGG